MPATQERQSNGSPDPYGPGVNQYERANRMKKATAIVLHLWCAWRNLPEADRAGKSFGDTVANMPREGQLQAAEAANQNPPGEDGKTWVVVTDLADRMERRDQADPFARFVRD